METNNKNVWPWVAGAIVIVIIGVAIWQSRQNAPAMNDEAPTQNEQMAPSDTTEPETPTEATEPETSPKPSTSAPKPSTSAPMPDNSYETAIKTYKYRIQFVQCHGTSSILNNGTLTVKAGTKFMLDNRDKVTRTIAFAGQTYKIAAQKFAIASVAKAGTYNITCDGGGAAKLTIEN